MFRPRGHHAVRLVGALGDEVVDEHADVRLVAREHDGLPSFESERGVETRDEPLRRRLFVSAAAVDLTREIQSADELALEGGQKGGRVYAIVLDGVGVFGKTAMREPGHGAIHRLLDVVRQRTAHALDVHLVAVQPLGLDEDLMPLLVAETHDLVLDGGAIARSYAADAAVVKGAAVNVGEDDLVSAGVGVSEPAGLFLKCRDLGHERKPVRVLAELDLHLVKVDGITVNARGSARLEPPHGQTQPKQTCGEQVCGRLTGRTRTLGILPYDDLATEIYARREDDRVREDLLAVRELHAACRAARDKHFRSLALPHRERRHGAQSVHDHPLIERLVLLPSQGKDGGTFGRVEHLDLDEGFVRRKSHLPAEGVYLAHEMSLRGAAYRGIARHHRHRAETEAQHESTVPRPRTGESGFHARVSAAHNDDVVLVLLHVWFLLFSRFCGMCCRGFVQEPRGDERNSLAEARSLIYPRRTWRRWRPQRPRWRSCP